MKVRINWYQSHNTDGVKNNCIIIDFVTIFFLIAIYFVSDTINCYNRNKQLDILEQ